MRSASGIAPVRAVSRAVAILDAFVARGPHLTLTEIAQAAGLDKGTTRRLLYTLMRDGLIAYSAQTQRYSLGLAMLRYASAAPDRGDLRDLAGPVLQDLSKATQTTTILSIYHDGSAICLDRFHDELMLEVKWWRIGGSIPMNCGAASRVMLAYSPDAEASRALAQPLTPLTPHSQTDREALLAERTIVRERGWAMAMDDVVEGLSAAACPILDAGGRLAAVISMAGLTPHVLQDGRPRFLNELQAARREIEKRVG
ncbi:MAG: IclR family transcriptional regulator [Alphaproteobacteria bacterium]|nr:IclR family transcriptional regulator [Alphaproteobacteria bacterium]